MKDPDTLFVGVLHRLMGNVGFGRRLRRGEERAPTKPTVPAAD
jgi:hypothetical protein